MRRLGSLVNFLVVIGLVLASHGCGASRPASNSIVKTGSPASVPATALAAKTLTLVVPTAPGSTVDMTSRVYARFLPRYLPGNPAMIVRNMPGGDQAVGTNYVYASKPDGSTLLTVTSTALLAQMIGRSTVRYDLKKMPALIASPSGSMVYAKSSFARKPEDLPKAKGLIFGYTGGSASWIFITTKELLNIATDKIVMAYSGGGEAKRAFLAGEINMSSDTAAGYLEWLEAYVKSGEVTLLYQTGIIDEKGRISREPLLPPNVLTTGELYESIYGKPPSGSAWDAYQALVAVRGYNRILLLPPGTPDGLVMTYRSAVESMVKDSEFEGLTRSMFGEDAKWQIGESFDKAFKSGLRIDTPVLAWLKETLSSKYGVVVE